MQSEHSMSPLSRRLAGTILAPRAAALWKLLPSSRRKCQHKLTFLKNFFFSEWSSCYYTMWNLMEKSLPGLCTLEEGLKIAEWSSQLCFLLRPPGGAGSVARTPARLFEQFSPLGGSDLLGHREGSLEDDSSTGELLQMLKSDSWEKRRKRGLLSDLLIGEVDFFVRKTGTFSLIPNNEDEKEQEILQKQNHIFNNRNKPGRRIQASVWVAWGTWARQQVWWGGWSALPAEGAAASAAPRSQRRRRRARLRSEEGKRKAWC